MKRPPAIDRAVKRGLAPFRGKRTAGLLPRTRLAGPIPWVIAIMVALTAVAAAGALALGNMVAAARGDLAGSATVQIVEADDEARAAMVEEARDILAQDPAVAGLRVVPEETIAELLQPWLGTGDGSDIVPLPALVDVSMRDAAGPADYARIEAALQETIPTARIDAQADWLGPVLSALSSLTWMALVLIAMLALVAVAAIWLAVRNALAANRDTVEIVHLLGGSDDQIARLFQRSILIDAAAGSVLGLVAGALGVTFLARQFGALQSGMVAGGGLSPLDWLIIAMVPLFAVAIAVYTARMTVLSSLRKTL